MTGQGNRKNLILLTGDDDVLLTILSQIFTREGYENHIALDENTLKAVLDKKPDVIILDITRSPSQCLRLLDIMGEAAQKRTIVIASPSDKAHLKSMTTKISGEFIPKPFAMGELLAKVSSILKQYTPE